MVGHEELVRAIPELAGMPTHELDRAAAEIEQRDLATGEVLMTEGTPGREVYVITGGEMEVTIRGEQIATLGAGEIAGEMALLSHGPRSTTVTALVATSVLVLGPAQFVWAMRRPGFLRRIAATLVDRLRAAEGAPTY